VTDLGGELEQEALAKNNFQRPYTSFRSQSSLERLQLGRKLILKTCVANVLFVWLV